MSDQPAPLGDLDHIFRRRRIAVDRDSRGRMVLVRPDSVLVDIGVDRERRADLVSVVHRFDPQQAQRISEPDRVDPLGFETVRFTPSDRNQPERKGPWSLDAAHEHCVALADHGHDVQLNHVFLGAPIVANPLGAPATWAGETVFTGETVSNAHGQRLMRTTAEPAIAPPFLRRPLRIEGRRRPKVLVLDSGLRTLDSAGVTAEHPALRACRVHAPWSNRAAIKEVDDEDEPDVDATGTIDVQAGHGTFISGIVRQICPDAEIHIAGGLTSFGEGSVSGVLHAIRRVGRLSGPFDIVVMSFGAFFTDDNPGLFGRELTRLLGDSVGVAAAGNEQTSRPQFPAALPGVIGVGGLAASGRAWFTNFGSWVDACAPAVGVVSTFFEQFTETIDGQALRRYDGWARWSGTSFAAPKVAALIAQDMLRLRWHGERGVEADVVTRSFPLPRPWRGGQRLKTAGGIVALIGNAGNKASRKAPMNQVTLAQHNVDDPSPHPSRVVDAALDRLDCPDCRRRLTTGPPNGETMPVPSLELLGCAHCLCPTCVETVP